MEAVASTSTKWSRGCARYGIERTDAGETQGGPLHPRVKLTRGVDLSRRRVEAGSGRDTAVLWPVCRPTDAAPLLPPVSTLSYTSGPCPPTASVPPRPSPPPPHFPVHMPPRRPTAASPALLLLLLKGVAGGVVAARLRGTMTERKAASAGDRWNSYPLPRTLFRSPLVLSLPSLSLSLSLPLLLSISIFLARSIWPCFSFTLAFSSPFFRRMHLFARTHAIVSGRNEIEREREREEGRKRGLKVPVSVCLSLLRRNVRPSRTTPHDLSARMCGRRWPRLPFGQTELKFTLINHRSWPRVHDHLKNVWFEVILCFGTVLQSKRKGVVGN